MIDASKASLSLIVTVNFAVARLLRRDVHYANIRAGNAGLLMKFSHNSFITLIPFFLFSLSYTHNFVSQKIPQHELEIPRSFVKYFCYDNILLQVLPRQLVDWFFLFGLLMNTGWWQLTPAPCIMQYLHLFKWDGVRKILYSHNSLELIISEWWTGFSLNHCHKIIPSSGLHKRGRAMNTYESLVSSYAFSVVLMAFTAVSLIFFSLSKLLDRNTWSFLSVHMFYADKSIWISGRIVFRLNED